MKPPKNINENKYEKYFWDTNIVPTIKKISYKHSNTASVERIAPNIDY